MDQNSYVVGVAYRSNNNTSGRHFNVLALHSSTAMSRDPQLSICLSDTTVGIDFEGKTHYFAVKRPEVNSGENTYLAVGVAVGAGVPYGTNGNNAPRDAMLWSNKGDNTCGEIYKNAGEYNSGIGIQVIGSTQKSW